MDDNVVDMFSHRNTTAKEDPSLVFIRDHLLPWALENNLDVESTKFKLNGATIMTCIQGMLLDDI